MAEIDPTKLKEANEALADMKSGVITLDQLKTKLGELGVPIAALGTAFSALASGQLENVKVMSVLSQQMGPLASATSGLGRMFDGLKSKLLSGGEGLKRLGSAILPVAALTTDFGQRLASPLAPLDRYPGVLNKVNQGILNLRTTQLTAREASAMFG